MTPSLLLANVPSGGIPLWLVVPFGLLLLLIAAMPLTPHPVKHWWERHYPKVAIGLAGCVGIFYLLKIDGGGHVLGHTAMEYVSFIALIGSLFVVSGGIHIKSKGDATPLENVILLLIGAVLANFIGTTGASMVLIRPYIRTNKRRIQAYHVVFFIFIVSNCGGSLTPIGDPPLFLGYLRGVPFFWLTEHVMLMWMMVIGALLASFYAFDWHNFTRTPKKTQAIIEVPDTFNVDGRVNIIFLLVIIGAVFLPNVFLLRESVMIGAAAASYFLTPKRVHAENHFNFGPIKEVALLFVGIFITMMPALGYLEQHGKELGFTKPTQYYFATGSLSAVLDNAPTYVNFLKLAEVNATTGRPELRVASTDGGIAAMRVLLTNEAPLVIAVSLGAVFFGAMTYIGNGPNFMVKSIADGMGVEMPTFFGYMFKFSLPILLPILALAGWLFL